MPSSDWTAAFGRYVNREPGRPRLFSLLVYLNARWADEDDAETLMLDMPSGCGVLVRPQPGRVLLMDQDVVHRASMPSARAARPRFSLVWKLALLPCAPSRTAAPATPALARPQWGRPTAFGSAARADEVRAALAKEAVAARSAVGRADGEPAAKRMR